MNKIEKTQPKYLVKLKNPFDDTESSMEFPTVAAIAKFLNSKGMDICERTIHHYIIGDRTSPPFFTFAKFWNTLRYSCPNVQKYNIYIY